LYQEEDVMRSLKQIFHIIGGPSLTLFGFFVGLYANIIAERRPLKIAWTGIIVFGLISAIYLYIRNRRIEPNIKASALRDDIACKRNAHSGLIVFLSVYTNFKRKPPFTQEELKKLIAVKDYKGLDIPDMDATNFGHTIKAIRAHLPSLKHCWIITTKSARETGITSAEYLDLFIEFLCREVIAAGNDLKFHAGADYTVDLTEDSAVCIQTNELVSHIYSEAKHNLGLKASDIIADVTGGVTPMKVGTVLACLAKDQDVQVIGSLYDETTGRPKGGADSFPIIIGYGPQLILKE
jgi:hypothetical protein